MNKYYTTLTCNTSVFPSGWRLRWITYRQPYLRIPIASIAGHLWVSALLAVLSLAMSLNALSGPGLSKACAKLQPWCTSFLNVQLVAR